MKLTKVIPLILILAGVITISYPLMLTWQTQRNESVLRSQWDQAKSRQKEDIAKDSQGKTSSQSSLMSGPQSTGWQPMRVVIEKIALDVPVIEVKDLSNYQINQLPTHYPGTALPGNSGNIAIAGHRNGPAGYFARLNEVKQGDIIVLESINKQYRYQVEQTFVTSKNDWQVVDPTDYEALTLTTCEREGLDNTAKRLIVRAKRYNGG